ncbi:MAG: exodeoxyribonuclease VII large subunit [Clostridia bacterium]|nr:exodeoxyribonuclease VII large subunit [Clostridia bacterium]
MNEAISVTKFNTYIKSIFDAEELLHNISIVGEVFGVSFSRNVIYFSLKDENATLSCVCFYPNFINDIVEGEQVVISGSPNYYIKGGRFNFNVVKVSKVGQGKLFEEFLKLKEKLENEGLFSSAHKKSLPKHIQRIGVITSRDGAVIQDIKNVAWRRNPNVDIVLYHTKVQGINAENEIAHAIEVMGNYDNIDVIVVARGGGSLEDLWAYNTEIVARATYNCPKPIISAVGHETDFTIIDFVSDLRVPTPSAGAELLTFDISERKQEFSSLKTMFSNAVQHFTNRATQEVKGRAIQISSSISKILMQEEGLLKRTKDSFLSNAKSMIEQKLYEIGLNEQALIKSNPHEILNMGYAKIEQNGNNLSSVENVDYENNLQIYFKDGKVDAKPIK